MNLLLSIALIHLLACLSPGPDIFLVVRTSIRHGWRTATMTTLGILTGVSLQIALGLTGITYLVSRSEGLHDGIALAGATWLCYLGGRGFYQNLQTVGNSPAQGLTSKTRLTPRMAWSEGLLVNLLNAKALLFFLSLFSVMLGPDIPMALRILCGFTMVSVQAIAFTLVAVLVSRPFLHARWTSLQRWLDFGISFILIGLGLWIWIKTLISHLG